MRAPVSSCGMDNISTTATQCRLNIVRTTHDLAKTLFSRQHNMQMLVRVQRQCANEKDKIIEEKQTKQRSIASTRLMDKSVPHGDTSKEKSHGATRAKNAKRNKSFRSSFHYIECMATSKE